jgi:16S rRNA (adenine1518-N6/adenine1519-N6)-dimethyltransferase
VPILQIAGALDVIEIDDDVVPQLEASCAGRGELRVHRADALEFDLRALRGTGPRLRLLGNLPYNISTPLLFELMKITDRVVDQHFMLQKEVVERMVAGPGSKTYGRLSVMLQFRYRMTKLFDVPRGAFKPAPDVTSSIVRMLPLAAGDLPDIDPGAFARVVTAAFGKRRKTLRNALAELLATDAIEAAGVDPQARAETLGVDRFVALARQLER